MSRPPLEVADLVRAAGEAFIERNRHWLGWKHVKVLQAIARCRQLLGSTPQPQAEQHPSSTEDTPDLYPCPNCGGPMKIIERLTAAEIQLRSPPVLSAAA